MEIFVFILIAFIIIFVLAYRKSAGNNVYKYVSKQVGNVYDKYAPYSFKEVRQKVKDLGQEYTKKQYTFQIAIFAISAAVISYLYFYNLLVSLLYAVLAILTIPFLTYLRCKRIYSEFIFEQIQTYTTNTIMEVATTQAYMSLAY